MQTNDLAYVACLDFAVVFNKVPHQRLLMEFCICNTVAAFAWTSSLLQVSTKLKYVVSPQEREKEIVKFEESVPFCPKL